MTSIAEPAGSGHPHVDDGTDEGGFIHLRRAGVSVLFALRRDPDGDPGQPEIVHWGTDLGDLDSTDLTALAAARAAAVPRGVADEPVPHGLLPERARGYRGRPGVAGHRDGADFAPLLRHVGHHRSADGAAVVFRLADEAAGLAVESRWELDAAGILRIGQQLRNTGAEPYLLAELAVVLPVPADAGELLDFTGRWSRERMPQRRPFGLGAWTRENRRGRTAADSAYLTMAGTPGFGNRHGRVWALHLAWSGDQVTWAEAQPDGTQILGAAELLAPGEISLAPDETYRSPDVLAGYSDTGLDGVSERFHRHLRMRPGHPVSPRPATLNTWEAVYFDHDLARLTELADRAAELGIERFVLDDGWFGGRRSDASSLGDWVVSGQVWPAGLGPLVEHVTGLGMQFGLWVEPEMINPDSDLFRAHPDWVLAPAGRLPPPARHQQVLDVARPEVAALLFDRLDGLVKEYPISYFKWDHNRDLVDATHAGRAGVHAQTVAVYALLDRLRAANPGLEIESCASGGARIDLGILQRTDRVWVSDTNDARERQDIQRWTGLLLPPELMGTHVGPPRSHTTSRTQSLSFRVATALFGHFGVEWDISAAAEPERAALGAAVAAYRRLRPLLHTGTAVHADYPDPGATLSGVVALDRGWALFSYARLTTGPGETPPPLTFPGLDPKRHYRIRPLAPAGEPEFGHRRPPGWLADGVVILAGRVLATIGLAAPVLDPEQALLLEFRCTDAVPPAGPDPEDNWADSAATGAPPRP